jgi:1-deoxy-D-xylulose-5-phosphate synthase
MGGAGSAVAEALHAVGVSTPVLMLGLPDRFIPHGERGDLLAACGLDATGIECAVVERFGLPSPQATFECAASW